MEIPFKELLENQKYLPYTNGNWNNIMLDHTKGSNVTLERGKINTQLINNMKGVYIYTNEETSEVLYVGEGDLKNRLERHYGKTYQKENKENPRSKFFKSVEQRVKMLIYYTEIENVYERRAIEAMLTTVLKPKYNRYLRSF